MKTIIQIQILILMLVAFFLLGVLLENNRMKNSPGKVSFISTNGDEICHRLVNSGETLQIVGLNKVTLDGKNIGINFSP